MSELLAFALGALIGYLWARWLMRTWEKEACYDCKTNGRKP